IAIYPLKIFVVMLHEISHGMMSVATGGGIDRIVLDPQQGGACYCGGGNAFLTLSAGYLGSLVWGVLLLSAAQAKRIAGRHVMAA
ncbi:MAG: M50 family peptidase, partial [Akkermansiaceae bacterium]|nr:M50 family peptidase [Akkermansiaceae bacterium]